MKYRWSSLLNEHGKKISKPVSQPGIFFDLDKNKVATLFDGEKLIGSMRVMEIEAHAMGIYLRGIEEVGANRVMYQEWFLAYEKEDS